MDENVENAFKLLREVKSVAVATLDNGKPDIRIADVMMAQEDGLYFVTARGKPYYRQIRNNPKLAICGMDKNYVSVRIIGDIRFCNDRNVVDKVFDHNPVLNDLYPGEKRDILEAFYMYRGRGEMFDLSITPPRRKRFAFGGEAVNPSGYIITDRCTACGICLDACPVGAISEGDIYIIEGSRCLECGRCYETCPEDAIEPSQGM